MTYEWPQSARKPGAVLRWVSIPRPCTPRTTSAVVTTLLPSDLVYLVGLARDANLTLWYDVARADGSVIGWVIAANLQIENADINQADAQLPQADSSQTSSDMVVLPPTSPEPHPAALVPSELMP